MTKKYEINMSEGKILPKIILFAVPLMLSSILQLLYNAADIIVVGQFAQNGTTAIAAITSTGALINLIVNLLLGLSVGTNVVVARYFGAKDDRGVHETVHTAMLIALIGGVLFGAVGFFGSRTFLGWMDSPATVIDQATLYLQIYFLGLPASMIYNFGASILRAIGDTRRPLIHLAISGAANVLLNLLLVIVLQMDVAGVAIGTVASQVISAVCVVVCLLRAEGASFRLQLHKLKIYAHKLSVMAQTGIPAAIQGSAFSLPNVLIQSSINSFGDMAMAGSGSAANIEGFIYVAMNAFHHAALTFTSQNLGARKYERIKKVLLDCVLLVFVVGLALGVLAYVCGRPLLAIYDKNPEVIEYGIARMQIICLTYYICGIMDVFCGQIRGLGYSIAPMIVSLLGACGVRIIWIYTIFRLEPTLQYLYISYPVSWILTTVAHLICYSIAMKQVKKRMQRSLL